MKRLNPFLVPVHSLGCLSCMFPIVFSDDLMMWFYYVYQFNFQKRFLHDPYLFYLQVVMCQTAWLL